MSPSGLRRWALMQKQHLSIPAEPGAGQEFRSRCVGAASGTSGAHSWVATSLSMMCLSRDEADFPAPSTFASEARSQCLCLLWGDLSHQVFPSSLHSGLRIHGIYHPLPSSSALLCIWMCLCSFTVHLLLRNGSSSLFLFFLDLMFQQARAQQWSRAPLQLSVRV